MADDFLRYLTAKRTVDDRALDRGVWERLHRELHERGPEIAVADVGAGVGTGLDRMLEWGLFDGFSRVRYTAIEPQTPFTAGQRVRAHGLAKGSRLDTRRIVSDLVDVTGVDGTFDLVVAHALLDILDLETSLDRLIALAAPGGLLYFPITFDGETILEPALDTDDVVLRAYHETMSRRGRTGRLLIHALRAREVSVLRAASSDWLVLAHDDHYPDDERFFLDFLVDTVDGAVRETETVNTATLDGWLAMRRRQIASGQLVLIAHQLDVLARVTALSSKKTPDRRE